MHGRYGVATVESGSSTSNSHDNEEINHNGKIQSEGNYEEGGRGRNGGSTRHISKESDDGIFGTQTDIEISGKIGIDLIRFLCELLFDEVPGLQCGEDMFDDEEEEEEREGEDQQSKSGAQNNQEEQQVGNVEIVHGQMGEDSENGQGDTDIKQPNLSWLSFHDLSYAPAPQAAAALDMIQTAQNELDCLSAALPSVMSNNISGAEEASMAAEMAMAAADGLASLRGSSEIKIIQLRGPQRISDQRS